MYCKMTQNITYSKILNIIHGVAKNVSPNLGLEGPIAPFIHVFTPFFGRIHVVTLVEVLFLRARTS